MKNYKLNLKELTSIFGNKKFITEAVDGEKMITKKTDVKKNEFMRRITVQDIVQKINSIRAGRSLSNDEIRMQLELYFEDLSVADKNSLFAFLSGLAQIVTGEIAGQNAMEPKDLGIKHALKSDDDD